MPKSAELYLVLKAMNPLDDGDAGTPSPGVLSDAPPPRETDAPESATAAAVILGAANITHVPPWPPAPMHVAAIVDHVPPKPPAPMRIPATVDHVPPWPPAPHRRATAEARSASDPADSSPPMPPATVLSIALDDEPLEPPKSLRIQSVTIYGTREVALAWLKSVDGQVFAKDAQALHLLRISADDAA